MYGKRRLYTHNLKRILPEALREIELLVDDVLHTPYHAQFWRDCDVYGLWEAYVYLRNHVDSYRVDKESNNLKLERVRIKVQEVIDAVEKRQKL